MNKKSAANTTAVIEIGTDNMRMRVSQLSKGRLSTVDMLEYPIRLGHDVFEDGFVNFESLREVSGVLDKFSSALRGYNIQRPKVLSCSALRDAKNRSLVIDQLRVRNGMEVTVLDDSEEKAYIYGEIIKKLDGAEFLKEKNSVIAYVGSGSIGVAVYDGEKIIYSQNIPMGALKLFDIMHSILAASEDFHTVIEEYLDTIFNRVSFGAMPIKNLIITGTQIELISRLCGGSAEEKHGAISAEKLAELYLSIRSLTPERISLHYGIPEGQAAVLYTAVSIYKAMLRFCPKAKYIYSPSADITEAVARCTLSSKAEAERAAYIRESAIACAESAALKFGCDLNHSHHIQELSCRIFDKLRKIHGLDNGKRLILELASILHSCGSFVSVRQHSRCAFDLIRGMDIFGISQAEVMEVAFVAGSVIDDIDDGSEPYFARLTNKERLTISKLAAIFHIANALDKSHKAKLNDLKITVEDDRVVFKTASPGDTMLEQWAFRDASKVFEDVFGLSPELHIKFELL